MVNIGQFPPTSLLFLSQDFNHAERVTSLFFLSKTREAKPLTIS